VINGAGSTWAANAVELWRGELRQQRGIFLNYASTGSSDGRAQFAGGTVDFAVSDVPYGLKDAFGQADPVPRRPFTYLPSVAGGTSFAYNLRVDGRPVTDLRLSGETVTRIFTRDVTRWDDPRIKADNPGLALPSIDIVPVVRQDSAATTGHFTEWMSARYPELWNPYCQASGGTPPCGATVHFPADGHIGQSGSTGVAGYVAQASAEGAIGYVEYSYAINARLPSVKLLNAAGSYVAPTADAVTVALAAAEVVDNPADPATHLTQKLDKVFANPDPRAYPLSSYSYLVVPTTLEFGTDENKGYTVGELAYHALCQGQLRAPQLGYASLPPNLVRAGLDQVGRIPGAATRTAGEECQGTQPVPTRVALTASSPSVGFGEPVTLTAVVTPAGVGGVVEFRRGTTLIAAPVAVNVSGFASVTTTLPLGSHAVIAAFLPDDPAYTPVVSETVTVAVGESGGTPGQEIVAEIAPGPFSLAVASQNATLAGGIVGGQATGTLAAATVTDLRGANSGWNVVAQIEDFTQVGGAATIPGARLGWVPSAARVSGSGTVSAGGPVAPGTTPGGLADGVTLCSAAAGGSAGTFTCAAGLTLSIPATTAAGVYSATLTLTLA